MTLGLSTALWILLSLSRDLFDKVRQRRSIWKGLRSQSLSYWGMVLGHLGVAVTIVGATAVSHYAVEKSVRMAPDTSVEVAGYRFTMTDLFDKRGVNFLADTAVIEIQRGDSRRRFEMQPQKRLYLATGMPMTQVALSPGLFRDLYVAMGEELDDGSWAMRIQYKPFVRWLWLGGLLMAVGGVLAVFDKRYGRRARQDWCMRSRHETMLAIVSFTCCVFRLGAVFL